MSIFLERNHMFLRNPRGGVEDAQAMSEAGFGVIFCNIGDYAPYEWGLVRERARAAGVVCGPWLRTCDDDEEFSEERLARLIETADVWEAPFIVNSESELKGTGDETTGYIAELCQGYDWALSMEAWPFANVDWEPITVPVLPQIFPETPEHTANNPEACRAEWYRRGVECVVFTFGSYGAMTPDMFDRLSPFGVYTADDCGSDYRAWTALGEVDPCLQEDHDGHPVKIGSQHGITGFMGWLRAQPDVPPRPASYDPERLDTWPWPDKLERTLLMLVEEHDRGDG